MLEDWASPLSDLDNYDGVIEKAVQFKDSYSKAVIITGGFAIPDDSVWKDSDRIILFDANSFDFWFNWAVSKDQYGRQNIHPKITAFLEQHPEWLEPRPKEGQRAFSTRYTWANLSEDIYYIQESKEKYRDPDKYKNKYGKGLSDEVKEMYLSQLASGRTPRGWNSLDPNDVDDLERSAAMCVGVDAAAALKAFLCGKEVNHPMI